MSIGSFISSSLQLLKEGTHDVALSLACSAVDATSAKMFPNEKQNNARYKKFLKKNMRIITTFGMPGLSAGGIRIKCSNIPGIKTDAEGMAGLEDIIYHIIRCGLIHQCEIEESIEFTQGTMLGDFEQKFRIPYAIVLGLVMSVILAKENKNESMSKSHYLNLNSKNVDLNSLWGKVEYGA
jgi:hypothetical protein